MKSRILMSMAALALAGCVSVLPEQQVPEGLYRLGPMTSDVALFADVTVREPDASRLVGGRAIAAEASDGAIRFVPGVEWAEASTRMMQLALLDQLSGSDAGGTALAAGAGATATYEVSWRLSDFSLLGNTARCRLEVTLLNRSGRPVAQKTFTPQQTAASDRNADRALAMKAAGQACVSEVAAFVSAKAVREE